MSEEQAYMLRLGLGIWKTNVEVQNKNVFHKGKNSLTQNKAKFGDV